MFAGSGLCVLPSTKTPSFILLLEAADWFLRVETCESQNLKNAGAFS